jgi:hypothetical protein
MRRGLYRVPGLGGHPDDVRVEDDGIEMPLAESLYRSRGYLPPVEDLPWQEDYFGKKPAAAPAPSADKAAREEARQAFLTRFRKP